MSLTTNVSLAKGDVDGAIAGYKEVIELDSGFSLAYQALAEAHSRSGDLEAAVSAIQQAIEAEPGESLYHTSLSRFLQRMGKVPEAEKVLLELIEDGGGTRGDRVWYELAWARRKLGKEELALAAFLAPFGIDASLAVAQSLAWETVLIAVGATAGGLSWWIGSLKKAGTEEAA